jgi:hypothetical protein
MKLKIRQIWDNRVLIGASQTLNKINLTRASDTRQLR